MLTAIVSITLSFVLTGLVANRLLHGWQRRNWLEQQRVLERDKNLKTLNDILDEISFLSSLRHSKMVRLATALKGKNKQVIIKRFSEYDEILDTWNHKINPLFVKISMHIDSRYTYELEKIHEKFVASGRMLEILFQEFSSNESIDNNICKEALGNLNTIQKDLSKFQKNIINFINYKKSEFFDGIELNEENLYSIPTWELFKAVFNFRIKFHDIS